MTQLTKILQKVKNDKAIIMKRYLIKDVSFYRSIETKGLFRNYFETEANQAKVKIAFLINKKDAEIYYFLNITDDEYCQTHNAFILIKYDLHFKHCNDAKIISIEIYETYSYLITSVKPIINYLPFMEQIFYYCEFLLDKYGKIKYQTATPIKENK